MVHSTAETAAEIEFLCQFTDFIEPPVQALFGAYFDTSQFFENCATTPYRLLPIPWRWGRYTSRVYGSKRIVSAVRTIADISGA
jgi:hypothetical protein